MNALKPYLVTFGVFFIIDLLWLGVVAKNVYAKYLGHLMAPKVNWTAAILFYIIYVVALVLFVVQPALKQESLKYAILYGALLGCVAYAAYDLTNLATLKDWPITLTIIDLIWGTVLTASTASISYTLLKFLK